MSKHPSKSRIDKPGKTPSVVTLTPVTADIVPGKLTDNDWHALVDRDDSDEFIADIVEEIYVAADQWIYDLYLSRQVIPFTVWQAKDALVQIIEWIYLARDAGPSTDSTHWCEDDEPSTSVIDCWAQGSVPRQCVPDAPLCAVVEVEVEPVVPCVDNSEPVAADNDASTAEEAVILVLKDTCSECPQPDCDTGLEQTIIVNDPEDIPVVVMVPSISETCQMELPVSSEVLCQSDFLPAQDPSFPVEQYHANDDWPIDHQCNPIAMKKIPAQKLPSNRIETTFMIVDPQMADKPYRFSYGHADKYSSGRMNTNQSNNMKGPDRTSFMPEMKRASFMPQSLFETMEVAAGVTVRQMDRVKKGPKVHSARGEFVTKAIEKSLQPIRRQQCNDNIKIGDILDRNVPVIKPLYAPTPVPPISQRSFVS